MCRHPYLYISTVGVGTRLTPRSVPHRHGYTVCRHPYLYIGTVLAVTVACGIGLLNFHQENRPFKLWIPQDSDFVQTYDWMQEHYPREFRFENAIVTADNVLEPAVIREVRGERVTREVWAEGVIREVRGEGGVTRGVGRGGNWRSEGNRE